MYFIIINMIEKNCFVLNRNLIFLHSVYDRAKGSLEFTYKYFLN